MAPQPPPQSRFLEGSMNDRVSNAPPPDFLGPDAETTDEYERAFCPEWRPPDFSHGADGAGHGLGAFSISQLGSRSSFMTFNSGISAATTTRGWSKGTGHKNAGSSSASGFLAPARLWGGVKEKLSLNRSRSNNTIGANTIAGHEDDVFNGDRGHLIQPVFKHKRSESTKTAAPGPNGNLPQVDSNQSKNSAHPARLRKPAKHDAVGAPPQPPASGFDPSKRPTRDEITANYQSLLASGFFGTHAIQSARFGAPGQNLHHRQTRQNLPVDSSLAQPLAQDEQQMQCEKSPPPPPPAPERQPPPPPPIRGPPPPPALSVDSASSSSAAAGIPVSPTIVFNPIPKEPQHAPKDMLPPPSPPKKKKGHEKVLTFSAIPYSSTRPANGPSSPTAKSYKLPPISLPRFSLESGRRSFDLQRKNKDQNNEQRGTKRPFTDTNSSEASIDGAVGFVVNGEGGEAATATTDEGNESGARRLVKKLRKSASRLTVDLGRTISRQNSMTFGGDGDGDGDGDSDGDGVGMFLPPRPSMSNTVKRSFSWRLGRPQAGHADEPKKASSNNDDDTKAGLAVNKRSEITPVPAPAPAPAPATMRERPPPILSLFISPTNAERSKQKKREIRGRRLRRRDSTKSPGSGLRRQSPAPDVALTPTTDRHRDTTTANAMDWQSSPCQPSAGNRSRTRSQSRSRLCRSSTTAAMYSQSRPGTAQSTDGAVSAIPHSVFANGKADSNNDSVARDFSAQPWPQPRGSVEMDNSPSTDMMEGVEVAAQAAPSFHFPGRVKGPLAVVPDANRGIPSVPSIPASFGLKGDEYYDGRRNGRGENDDGGTDVHGEVVDGVALRSVSRILF